MAQVIGPNGPVPLQAGSFDYDLLKTGLETALGGAEAGRDARVYAALAAALVTVGAPLPVPAISFSSATQTVSEGVGTVANVINVVRNGVVGDLIINLSYGGSAINGSDFATGPASVTILAGQNSVSFNLSITDDATVETVEAIVITAQPAAYQSAIATRTISITDNDTPTISFSTATASIGESGGTIANTINVARNGVTGDLVVNLSYAGTAVAGTDYTAGPTTVTILAANSSVSFNLAITDDTAVESSEAIIVNAVLAAYGTATAQRTITIVDNDSAPTVPAAVKANAQKAVTGYQANAAPALMASPPTFTLGAANTASTVRTASTTSYQGGQFDITDANVQAVSGLFALSTNKFVGAGMSNGQGALRGTNAMTFRFRTNAPAFDMCYFEGTTQVQTNPGVALYVVNPSTGVRQRAQADDYRSNDSAAWRYLKWDFGSDADRIIEITLDATASIRSLNLSPTYSLTALPAVPAAQPKMQFCWDSYGEPGVVSQASVTSDMVKKSIPSQIAERFGCPAPQNVSRGGTGFLNPGGSFGTYQTRRGYGDSTRYGQQEIYLTFGSPNDDVGVNTAYTDQALSDAMTAYFTALATDQPSPAIIVGSGPATTATRAANQVRWDIMKAAFNAVAAADAVPLRFIWLDGSPSGDNWYAGITDGPDNTHLQRPDVTVVATRYSTTLYNALAAKAA